MWRSAALRSCALAASMISVTAARALAAHSSMHPAPGITDVLTWPASMGRLLVNSLLNTAHACPTVRARCAASSTAQHLKGCACAVRQCARAVHQCTRPQRARAHRVVAKEVVEELARVRDLDGVGVGLQHGHEQAPGEDVHHGCRLRARAKGSKDIATRPYKSRVSRQHTNDLCAHTRQPEVLAPAGAASVQSCCAGTAAPVGLSLQHPTIRQVQKGCSPARTLRYDSGTTHPPGSRGAARAHRQNQVEQHHHRVAQPVERRPAQHQPLLPGRPQAG